MVREAGRIVGARRVRGREWLKPPAIEEGWGIGKVSGRRIWKQRPEKGRLGHQAREVISRPQMWAGLSCPRSEGFLLQRGLRDSRPSIRKLIPIDHLHCTSFHFCFYHSPLRQELPLFATQGKGDSER